MNPILVQVNGIWRRVKKRADHPAGVMYILHPRPGEPNAIPVARVTRSLSRIWGEGDPAPIPALAS